MDDELTESLLVKKDKVLSLNIEDKQKELKDDKVNESETCGICKALMNILYDFSSYLSII